MCLFFWSVAFQFNFRGTLDDSQRAILQIKVVELLDEACLRLRQRFDYSREGEDELEVGEYRLHRALVELGEIEKEREPSTQKWRDRVSCIFLINISIFLHLVFLSFEYACLDVIINM